MRTENVWIYLIETPDFIVCIENKIMAAVYNPLNIIKRTVCTDMVIRNVFFISSLHDVSLILMN